MKINIATPLKNSCYIRADKNSYGAIHKPCGHGRGCYQIPILLHKPYIVKMSTKRGRGQKISKKNFTWFMNDPY